MPFVAIFMNIQFMLKRCKCWAPNDDPAFFSPESECPRDIYTFLLNLTPEMWVHTALKIVYITQFIFIYLFYILC